MFNFLFSTFTEFAMVIYKTKMSIAHIQCLLRIDGSVLPGVFYPPVLCLSLQVSSPMQQVAAYLYM